MKVLAHISDLHFGRTDPALIEGLIRDLTTQRPDLVVISGDLTQRARTHQFREAQRFLERLPSAYMVIPGNHDMPPLWRPMQRLLQPWRRYKRFISDELCPVYTDEEIAVLGINTARGTRWKEGDISSEQLAMLERELGRLEEALFKVVFTHHPFLPPSDAPATTLVGKAPAALAIMERHGVDLLLAGHLHRGYHGDVMTHHTAIKRSILVCQASTAVSTRIRDEPNAYNCITIDRGRLAVHVRAWTGDRFHGDETIWFAKLDHRWIREGQAGPDLASMVRRAERRVH